MENPNNETETTPTPNVACDNAIPTRPQYTLDFGCAIRALKTGKKVVRKGWNGKGMWLSLTPGRKVPAENLWSERNREYAEAQPDKQVEVLPYITMKTADDKIVPWLASQTDVLAEDWEITD